MDKPVDFIIELFSSPSFSGEGRDKAAHQGGCTQDCPHCAFSAHRPGVVGARTVSDQVLEALRQTQAAMMESNRSDGARFLGLSLPTGLPPLGVAPLFENTPLLPTFPPETVGFGFGNLSRLSFGDLEYPQLLHRLASHAPFKFNRKPVLRVDYRIPLRELVASESDLNRAIVLGRNLLKGLQSPSSFDGNVFSYSETVNAYPEPKDLLNSDFLHAKREQVRRLMAELFPEEKEASGAVPEFYPSEDAVSTDFTFQATFGVFVYNCRVIPQKPSLHATALTEMNTPVFGISFFPDFVWINHSTYTGRDSTVRFTYKDYFEILKESGARGSFLRELIVKKVLERRQRSAASPM